MNPKINDLMNQAMPIIDWKARHGVELNNGERMKWYAQWFENFAGLIIDECAEHALTFNNNIQSLNDKEIRSHACRVSDYIKDRMGVKNES
jgi:hypothetical protein